MARIGRLTFNLLPKQAERDRANNWWYYYQVFGDVLNEIDCFKPENAYLLALGISEIFNPIDAIADRVSSVPYVKKNDKGEVVPFTQSEERIMKQPNVFSTMEQLIYSLVFSELADGNSYLYTKIPDSYKTITPDRISSLWCLRPDCTSIIQNRETPRLFSVTKISDLVEYYQYDMTGDKINPGFVIHTYNQPLRLNECKDLKANSPLVAVTKNINNLLAVYKARFNVYHNNGIAGIITKKSSGVNGNLEEAVSPTTRKEIADDLMNKHAIDGHGNIKGISHIPLDFIKTIATIAELEPFRETWNDAVHIAGTFGVPKELLPREDNDTYANKEQAETGFWQNVVKGVAEDIGKLLTKAMGITDGIISPVFDNVECLQEDKKTNLETDSIELDNLKKMQELGENVQPLVKKIMQKYETA